MPRPQREEGKTFYGLTIENLLDKAQDLTLRKEISFQSALQINHLITHAVLDNGKPVIDWLQKTDITRK
jgi:hypothetical protein